MDLLTEHQRFRVRAVREFAAEHGHTNVPYSFTTAEAGALGAWVSKRRTQHRRGNGDSALHVALESIDGWTWSSRQTSFAAGRREQAISEFTKYFDAHGTADVPHDHVTESGFNLGVWVSTMRSKHRTGRLSDSAASALNAVPNWRWEPTSRKEPRRNHLVAGVRAFVLEHGHTGVRFDYTDSTGYRLGLAVANARSRFRLGTISSALRRELETVPGWTWERYASGRAAFFQALDEFIAEHGHTNMPASHQSPSGLHLGRAVYDLRRDPNGVAEPFREQLAKRPEWTWVKYKPAARQDWMQELRQFVNTHGHANVPQLHRTDEGLLLGRWVQKARSRYKKGELTAAMIADLEQMPGWVWAASRRNRAMRDGKIAE